MVLKSMTGFGRGEYLDKEHRFLIEVKAVNHRFNEIVIRMPKNLGQLEDKIRRYIAQELPRGRIDVFVSVDEYSSQQRVIRVDKELALAYYNGLRELERSVWGSDKKIDEQYLFNIAKFPDVLKVEEFAEEAELLWPKLHEALQVATKNLLIMRKTEGENIERDLRMRIDKLEQQVGLIELRAPEIVSEYRNKLLDRMRDILQSVGAHPEDNRILQEAALFADRISITEELVRLKSHIDQFRNNLGSIGAVGRKLDFIIQEINRETNTIASKSNDYQVANIVVEIKSEIEKVREQIQNIE